MTKAKLLILHIIVVILAAIGGVLTVADKIAALPLPPNWASYWGVFITMAVSAKPLCLVLADLMDDGQLNNSFKPLLIMGGIFSTTLALAACATDTGNVAADARGRATNQALIEATNILGKMSVSALLNAAQSEASGGKADFQSSLAAGLWSNINAVSTVQAFQRVSEAYSAGKTPATNAVAASVFANLATSENAPEVINAIATVVSAAATK